MSTWFLLGKRDRRISRGFRQGTPRRESGLKGEIGTDVRLLKAGHGNGRTSKLDGLNNMRSASRGSLTLTRIEARRFSPGAS